MCRFPRPYNLNRGKNSASARWQVDSNRVRGRVRARRVVTPGAARNCSHSFWRRPTEPHSALRHCRSSLECEESFPESPPVLGPSEPGFGNVAGLASHVDLPRSLRAARGAQSLCRGRDSLSTYRSHDGCGGSPTPCSTGRSLASVCTFSIL